MQPIDPCRGITMPIGCKLPFLLFQEMPEPDGLRVRILQIPGTRGYRISLEVLSGATHITKYLAKALSALENNRRVERQERPEKQHEDVGENTRFLLATNIRASCLGRGGRLRGWTTHGRRGARTAGGDNDQTQPESDSYLRHESTRPLGVTRHRHGT